MATLDVLTLSEAHQAVNIRDTDTTQDVATELAVYVSAVSSRLDELAGPVVVRAVAGETHDGGNSRVLLKQWPVASITTVTEYSGTTALVLTAQTNASQTPNDYAVDLGSGVLRRRSSNIARSFAVGVGNIVVDYIAGRFANTATVDARFKLAAAIMLANLFKQGGAGLDQNRNVPFGQFPTLVGIPTFAVPNAVIELLPEINRPRTA